MTAAARTYIAALGLQAHPEGGFFRETYRSDQVMEVAAADAGAVVRRNVCTGIYFLLEQGDFSAFHRIKSDEMWHFYAGQALEAPMATQTAPGRTAKLSTLWSGWL